MSKYVNADELTQVLQGIRVSGAKVLDFNDALDWVCDVIGELPVVDIVHCKDCKHYTTDNGGGCNKENGGLMFATETDFCSYGERKETNE